MTPRWIDNRHLAMVEFDGAAPTRHPRRVGADLLRTVGALLLAGFLAPLLFGLLQICSGALSGYDLLTGPSSFSVPELVGFTAMVLILGVPLSLTSACICLPCIYLARSLHLASPWVFSCGGAVLALGCTAWWAHGDVPSRIAEWLPFAMFAAMTGATCGLLCWVIAERPCGNSEGSGIGS
jgi:hypothetical protein